MDSAGETETNSDYQKFRNRLSPAARKACEDQSIDDDESDWPDEREPAYCLVICPDGEVPTLQTFHTPEELAERMRHYSDSDVYAFPFIGIPLPFTEAPARVMFLPDDTAVAVNAEGSVAVAAADDSVKDVILQDDWFLGAPELHLVTARAAEKPAEEADEESEDFPAD